MGRLWSSVCCVLLAALSVWGPTLVAQEAVESTRDAEKSLRDEDARELLVAERFVAVLEKNPRRGTALDKVYAFHVERSSLDSTIAAYREQADKGIGGQGDKGREKDAAAIWMIVGLLESLRGDEAAAVKAFENAERLAPQNALVSYYLGQTLVLVGQSDKGAEAFERAIARQPARTDLLEMFQALGRVYQRTAQRDKALDVWNRLEQQFPDDERVQEQIATTLLEEEAFDAALPRFEKLAQSAKDRSRQLAFRMEAADIKVRLGQTDVALKEFESLLGQLNPDHWVYRDVRRRIEAIYLRTEDRAGLAKYYEEWLAKHPDDLDAITRVAKVLAAIGRDATAREWLERGVKLAPSRKELRRVLIDRLIESHKYGEALAHFEQLDRIEPNNPDTLRDWGRALLKDPSRGELTRRQAAALVWQRLADAKPNDPLVASQVGDLLKQAEMIDEAVEQYRRAIAIAPEATQYREYLGEYFHSLKRPEDALATWRPMADGDRRTAANVARLGEVLSEFGYVEEAIANYTEACRLDPKDFGLQLKRVDLLARAERHEEAIVYLATVAKLVANEEEHEAWLSRDLRSLLAAGKLKERIATVEKAGQGDTGTRGAGEKKDQEIAKRWYWLARAYEAERQFFAAARAVTKAGELAPRSIPILRASARILEVRRDLLGAVAVYTRLVTLDRRYRTEYLQQLASLERQLGRKDKALQAGRDLIAAAPGNPELAEFFAQLCFQLGAADEGLNALRRSVRANATDPLALVRLASALIERQRAGEAVDLLWRAFDKSEKLDDRLLIVQKLVEAHAAANLTPRVFERLQRMQLEKSRRREMTLCLAQAHSASGNDAQAQKELETLLTEESRDTSLLAQLRQLAEKRQDWTTAANYQRQVWQLTRDKRDRFQLAALLMKLDQVDEAVELLVGGESSRELTGEVLKLLDGLYEAGQTEVLLARLKPLRDRFPDNWELLYREGIALAKTKPEEAARRFEAILALNGRDDEPAQATPSRFTASATSSTGTPMPLVDRMNKIQAITNMTKFVVTSAGRPVQTMPRLVRPGTTVVVRTPPQPRLYYWAPRDYGEVRIAAWGWLASFATRAKTTQELSARVGPLDSSSTRQSLIDQYAVHRFLVNDALAEKAARKLAQHDESGPEETTLYFQTLAKRHQPKNRTMANGMTVVDQASPAPLYDGELDEMLVMYRELAQRTDARAPNPTNLQTVISELALAGRAAAANQLLDEGIDKAATETQLNVVLMVVYTIQARNQIKQVELKTATLTRLMDRMIELRGESVANRGASTPSTGTTGGGARVSRIGVGYLGNVIQMQLGRVRDMTEGELLGLWSRYLKLESFALAERLKQPEGRSATSAQQAVTQLSTTQVNPLALGVVFDQTAPVILMVVWGRHQSVKLQQECLAEFESRSQSPDISSEERILWLSALGHLRWNNAEKESAIKSWTEAAALAPQVVEIQLNFARLFELVGQSPRALEIVEAILPTTNDWQVEREQMALRLTLAADNKDRAKAAAERLAGLKLEPFEFLPLAEQMVKLDMADGAESLLMRLNTPAAANSRSQLDLRAQRVLLDIQLSRGRTDEATQTALALLQVLENNDPRSLTAQQTLNLRGGGQQIVTATNGQQFIMTTVNGRQTVTPVSGRVAPQPTISIPEYRQHVFQALHKTGKLAAMIEEGEAKLKETPLNEPLIIRLMTYHTAAGNSERLTQLTVQQLEVEQNRPDKRYAAIANLLNLGRPDEAATQVKLLMEAHSDYFAARCRDTISRFKHKQELRKLAKVFDQFDWSRYEKFPDLLPMVIDQLAHEIETEDIASNLFITAWKARPERRLELLTFSPDEQWWKRPEIVDGLRRLPIPTKEADLANQWSAFGRPLRKPYARPTLTGALSDGAPFVTVLNRLLTVEAERDGLKTLAGEVERGRQQFPDWTAGKVLLALIDLRRERVAVGRDVLVELLPSLSKLTQTSPAIPWEIAEELARHDESFDAAVLYYEVALRDRGTEAWTSSTSPVHGIVQSLAQRGRKSEARRMLLSLLPTNTRRGGDPAKLPSSLELQVAQWVGRELRGIGHHVHAIHVYQAALERAEGMSIGGHDPRVDLQSSLLIAFKELQPESLIEFFAAMGDAAPQLDLQLFVTEPRTPAIRLRSRWQPLVSEMAKSPEVASRMKSALTDVRRKHPDDLVTLVLSAQLALAVNDGDGTATSIEALVRFVEQHPLTERSTEPAKVAVQNHAARTQVGLWLIARECLADAALAKAGTELAERSLQAAHQQIDKSSAEAVRAEWLAIARQAGDATTAERLERELGLPSKP